MPRVQVYLTEETYAIYQTLENKSQWIQDKLYELDDEEKQNIKQKELTDNGKRS